MDISPLATAISVLSNFMLHRLSHLSLFAAGREGGIGALAFNFEREIVSLNSFDLSRGNCGGNISEAGFVARRSEPTTHDE